MIKTAALNSLSANMPGADAAWMFFRDDRSQSQNHHQSAANNKTRYVTGECSLRTVWLRTISLRFCSKASDLIQARDRIAKRNNQESFFPEVNCLKGHSYPLLCLWYLTLNHTTHRNFATTSATRKKISQWLTIIKGRSK